MKILDVIKKYASDGPQRTPRQVFYLLVKNHGYENSREAYDDVALAMEASQ